jgi:excisionase family DNA binding protein
MSHKPPAAYVHGLAGPVVVVPARIAALLVRRLGLAAFARDARGIDPELDAVLVALRDAGYRWAAARGCPPATDHDGGDVLEARSPWMTTAAAAQRLGVTRQAITRAIREGRLPGQRLGARWVVDPDDVELLAGQRRAS